MKDTISIDTTRARELIEQARTLTTEIRKLAANPRAEAHVRSLLSSASNATMAAEQQMEAAVRANGH